jgi:hypothetical protein
MVSKLAQTSKHQLSLLDHILSSTALSYEGSSEANTFQF